VRHLIEHTIHLALGARAVVANNVDEQRVVCLPYFFHGTVESANLIIGMLAEACVGLHLTSEQLLLIGRERRPVFYVFGLWRELGISRNNAEFLLTFERFLSHFVPALIELALILLTPFGWHVMRSVGCAGCIVHEERLVRARRFLELHP